MSPEAAVKVGRAKPQTRSLLMQLPRELRIIIYAFLFSSTRFTSGKRCSYKSVVYRYISAPHGLAILFSCRQAYVEIGQSWVGHVLFCFKTPRAMLDKLGDIPLETRSMIRHVRVSGCCINICCRGDWKRYDIHHVLKLLPGLKLDRLTVCNSDNVHTCYDILDRLVKYSDGWKELHYKSHNSGFLGYYRAWFNHVDNSGGGIGFFREPQPGAWHRKLEHRDGSNSGTSVTIYRSYNPLRDYYAPYISGAGTWIKFTQVLAPNQDNEEYQKANDLQFKARGEMEKEVLVVVKRGRGVDYEEKQGSSYLKAGDIRESFPGKTWAEILGSQDEIGSNTRRGVNHNDNRT